MKDIFGNIENPKNKYICFQDESKCEESNFLYHGFLFVKKEFIIQIVENLIDSKTNIYKKKKEIHFTECRNHPNSKYGNKTKVAINWLRKSKTWLKNEKIRFYILGINTNNIRNFWQNEYSYEHNIYSTFFKIGLKSAIGWFSKYEKEKYNKIFDIDQLFFDPNSEFNKERKEKAKWLSYEIEREKVFSNLNRSKIDKLDSDEKISENRLSNLIQLTDIIMGVTRIAFIEISKNAPGQKECLNEFIDLIKHFTDEKKHITPIMIIIKCMHCNFSPLKIKDLRKKI